MTLRLPSGGRINRARSIGFTFDGKELEGFEGDTLASALLANKVQLVGRSFKYHRPRGIFSVGPEEPNALVTLGTGSNRVANLPATTLELFDGLGAESQNRWPTLKHDLQSINQLFAPFLAAGFYYKTFMGPTRWAWKFYEHFIRKAAGLGRASLEASSGSYDVRNMFTDVAIVGAGPAGLAAARAAALAGARVTLIEQDFRLGGQLLAEASGGEADGWLKQIEPQIRKLPNVTLMTRTSAFGVYDDNVLGLIEHKPRSSHSTGDGLVVLRARRIIFATGAIERALVFPNNDRPGVMLCGAVRSYLNRFAVLPGRKIALFTNNDFAYRTAFDLATAGAAVNIVDQREPSAALIQRCADFGIEVYRQSKVTNVLGRTSVRAVEISGPQGRQQMEADLLCISGGYSPSLHLTSHLGAKPAYRADIDAFVPGGFAQDHGGAGAVMGTYSTQLALSEGYDAGLTAAAACGKSLAVAPIPPLALEGEGSIHQPADVSIVRGKAFVDFQMDVTMDDLALAHREGYERIEHLKRYTTLGLGTDQGKTSNFAAISIMSKLRGSSIPNTGTTTFRPPFTPISIGALAGRSVGEHYKPVRRTPMHDWHERHGAQMLEVGLWMRPWFYQSAGRDVNEAYVAEMRGVRRHAGLMDISTLGKIEMQGPDAATFMDRIYVNGFAKLPVGRARYGVMLRDDGVVFDDGTATRVGEHRYFMTTSTARAADVLSRLEFLLDTAWADLRVSVTSVTDEWAAMSIAGPQSRDILAKVFPTLDVSDGALPHMGLVEGSYSARPLRILRLSYSGERAYEVYVGATAGEALWNALAEAGKPMGLVPYGVEALGALRVEKGHIAGPEIDGRTTLDDLGLARMAGKRRGFVGDVLQRRAAFLKPDRQQLVGLECLESGKRLRGGAILFRPDEAARGHGRGRITSVTYSPTLDRYVALGLLAKDNIAEGTEVLAVYPMKGEKVRARVVSPVFLDPKGERLHG